MQPQEQLMQLSSCALWHLLCFNQVWIDLHSSQRPAPVIGCVKQQQVDIIAFEQCANQHDTDADTAVTTTAVTTYAHQLLMGMCLTEFSSYPSTSAANPPPSPPPRQHSGPSSHVLLHRGGWCTACCINQASCSGCGQHSGSSPGAIPPPALHCGAACPGGSSPGRAQQRAQQRPGGCSSLPGCPGLTGPASPAQAGARCHCSSAGCCRWPCYFISTAL